MEEELLKITGEKYDKAIAGIAYAHHHVGIR